MSGQSTLTMFLQVKAWCYYESRLLGAHHSLLSTYALETMVLYIFNMYVEELSSPLKVCWGNICNTHAVPVLQNLHVVPTCQAGKLSRWRRWAVRLQVLRKFLDVFSAFDWDNKALSLQGPIPLSAFDDPKGVLLLELASALIVCAQA